MRKLTGKMTALFVAACLGLAVPGIGPVPGGALVQAAAARTYALTSAVKVYQTA